MTDAPMPLEFNPFDLERAASVFVTHILRHLAGGSSRHDLIRSLQDFHEALVGAGNWKNVGDVLERLWVLDNPPQHEKMFDDIERWLLELRIPALRLAADQFSFNSIQKSLAKDDMMRCMENIERIRMRGKRGLFR